MSNMDTNFDLQEYLTKGVEGVIADAIKATFTHRFLWHCAMDAC